MKVTREFLLGIPDGGLVLAELDENSKWGDTRYCLGVVYDTHIYDAEFLREDNRHVELLYWRITSEVVDYIYLNDTVNLDDLVDYLSSDQ